VKPSGADRSNGEERSESGGRDSSSELTSSRASFSCSSSANFLQHLTDRASHERIVGTIERGARPPYETAEGSHRPPAESLRSAFAECGILRLERSALSAAVIVAVVRVSAPQPADRLALVATRVGSSPSRLEDRRMRRANEGAALEIRARRLGFVPSRLGFELLRVGVFEARLGDEVLRLPGVNPRGGSHGSMRAGPFYR
jgi:hypothetical protein